MKNRFKAPGDFAQAYVVAHEVGHHVQTLLGISGKVHILVIGKWMAGKISKLIIRLLEKKGVDVTLIYFFENIIFYTLIIVVIIAAAGQLGINTILNTPDNQKIILPNSNITSNVITNVTANDTCRVDLVIGSSYDDNIKKAKEVLQKIVQEDARVLDTPKPTIAVSELSDSCVKFIVRPWVKTSEYWNVYFDLTEKIKLTFDEEGISIPFPQQDIHLYQEQAVEK